MWIWIGLLLSTAAVPIQSRLLETFLAPIEPLVAMGLCGGANILGIGLSLSLKCVADDLFEALLNRKRVRLWLGAVFLTGCLVAIIHAVLLGLLAGYFSGARAAPHEFLPSTLSLAALNFVFLTGLTTTYLILHAFARMRSGGMTGGVRGEMNREVQMLRGKLDAHFLFNTLTGMAADAGNNERILAAIRGLSGFLHFSLRHRDDMLIPFGLEMDAAVDLLNAEKLLFGDGLDFSLNIDPICRQVLVPGVFLQPLMENAIKYGRRTEQDVLHLCVNATLEEGFFRIQVANTGRWVAPGRRDDSTQYGHEVIRRHLELLYPNRSRFEISIRGRWVIAEILIRETTVAAPTRIPPKPTKMSQPSRAPTHAPDQSPDRR